MMRPKAAPRLTFEADRFFLRKHVVNHFSPVSIARTPFSNSDRIHGLKFRSIFPAKIVFTDDQQNPGRCDSIFLFI